jgi:hypothetical protein
MSGDRKITVRVGKCGFEKKEKCHTWGQEQEEEDGRLDCIREAYLRKFSYPAATRIRFPCFHG